MKQVADTIEQLAQHIEPSDERFEYKVTDTFTLRCKSSKPALLALAKRLRKGYKRLTLVSPEPLNDKRRYEHGVFERFVRDGEFENAIEYNNLFNRITISTPSGQPLVKVAPVPRDERFVVARVYCDGKLTEWNVYHIDSGMSAGSASTDKVGALLKFNDVSDEQIERAIKSINNG